MIEEERIETVYYCADVPCSRFGSEPGEQQSLIYISETKLNDFSSCVLTVEGKNTSNLSVPREIKFLRKT